MTQFKYIRKTLDGMYKNQIQALDYLENLWIRVNAEEIKAETERLTSEKEKLFQSVLSTQKTIREVLETRKSTPKIITMLIEEIRNINIASRFLDHGIENPYYNEIEMIGMKGNQGKIKEEKNFMIALLQELAYRIQKERYKTRRDSLQSYTLPNEILE